MHTPLLETESRARAYKKIQAALKGKDTELRVHNIVLLPKTHDLVSALASNFEITGASSISFSDSMFNGIFVEEAILLRADLKVPPPTPPWFKKSWLEP